MNRLAFLTAATALAAAGVYAAPAKKAASPPPPIATYWMDASTSSGMGAGMMGANGSGGRPDIGQIMAMMNGGGSAVSHSLGLTLASREKSAAPQADHMIPPGLQMGPSLPLIAPERVREEPTTGMPPNFQRPKGRMLVYWGCGEHVAAGQPTVIDFAKVAAGQMPAGMAQLSGLARMVHRPNSAPGFGEWPNRQDSRSVPASGSLVGPHKVQANYAPPIAFTLNAGQDFMPGLGLSEAGAMPSGAVRLRWQPASQATGYALAMFGAAENGDVIMWSSGKGFPALDFLTPSEVKRLIAAARVLPPSTSECILPAEVASASPAGMVTMIGYGPEADFSDNPKAPKWVAKVRYKTTATLIRGMGEMGADGSAQIEARQPQPAKKKKKRFGLGDLIGGAIPH
jgi:hypothetical protein